MNERRKPGQSSRVPWRCGVVALVFVLMSAVSPCARGELMLPAMFSNHMVLQRNQPIKLWGWATPGERVWVSFKEVDEQTFAGPDGRWEVELPAMPADATGSRLIIVASNTIELQDVVVGEVWLCSGQSNMEFPLWDSEGGQEATASANLPHIRLLNVGNVTSQRLMNDITSSGWERCTPETASGFSAVAFYFGQKLHETLGVPIGLIQADMDGSPIGAWISREALASSPEARPIIERYNRNAARWPELYAKWQQKLKDYQSSSKPTFHSDPSDRGLEKGYAAPAYSDAEWTDIEVPGTFERALGRTDGVVWYRKALQIPPQWVGRRLRVSLGTIDDHDQTFFNAERIGSTGPETRSPHARPRRYEVPAELVRTQDVTLAVRVFDASAGGGILGPRGQMVIEPVDAIDHAPSWLAISGTWKARVEVALSPADISGFEDGPPMPMGPGHPHQPGGLFSGMIWPLAPYPLAGVLWYQGEANTGRAEQYETLLPMLIRDWRERWDTTLPFYIVQLAGYNKPEPQPVESTWAELRDAQLNTYQRVPGTGLVVAVDLGDADDIHPTRKRGVGTRLARWPLHQMYNRREIIPSGPIYEKADFDNGSATIRFDLFGGSLTVRGGGKPTGFTIAGKDRVFYSAQAQIEGDTVIVWASQVRDPVAVRYAWQDNPTDANLINSEGLPASPFRTDRWPGLTANQR